MLAYANVLDALLELSSRNTIPSTVIAVTGSYCGGGLSYEGNLNAKVFTPIFDTANSSNLNNYICWDYRHVYYSPALT